MKLECWQSEDPTLNSAGAEHYEAIPRLQTRLSIPHSSCLAREISGPVLDTLSGCPGIKGREVNKREIRKEKLKIWKMGSGLEARTERKGRGKERGGGRLRHAYREKHKHKEGSRFARTSGT